MKVAITGYLGMLGSELYKLFREKNNTVTGFDRDKFDLTDFSRTESEIAKFSPDILIHTAAMTDVDGCEKEPSQAEMLNHLVTENLAKICGKKKIKLVYISTDYVFSGKKQDYYIESDTTHPISVYGWTKLRGEKKVKKHKRNLIIRISWLFGKKRKNFVNFVVDNLKKDSEIRIINDQVGTPTYAVDLSLAIKFLIQKDASGIFHCSNSDECTWYDWAVYIQKISRLGGEITPISVKDFPRPAPRPKNSRLLNSRLVEEYSYKMPSWHNATKRFLKELGY